MTFLKNKASKPIEPTTVSYAENADNLIGEYLALTGLATSLTESMKELSGKIFEEQEIVQAEIMDLARVKEELSSTRDSLIEFATKFEQISTN